jgi:hypothetical protein
MNIKHTIILAVASFSIANLNGAAQKPKHDIVDGRCIHHTYSKKAVITAGVMAITTGGLALLAGNQMLPQADPVAVPAHCRDFDQYGQYHSNAESSKICMRLQAGKITKPSSATEQLKNHVAAPMLIGAGTTMACNGASLVFKGTFKYEEYLAATHAKHGCLNQPN